MSADKCLRTVRGYEASRKRELLQYRNSIIAAGTIFQHDYRWGLQLRPLRERRYGPFQLQQSTGQLSLRFRSDRHVSDGPGVRHIHTLHLAGRNTTRQDLCDPEIKWTESKGRDGGGDNHRPHRCSPAHGFGPSPRTSRSRLLEDEHYPLAGITLPREITTAMGRWAQERKHISNGVMWWERFVKRKIRHPFVSEGTERRREETTMEIFYHACLYDVLQDTKPQEEKW